MTFGFFECNFSESNFAFYSLDHMVETVMVCNILRAQHLNRPQETLQLPQFHCLAPALITYNF